MARRKKQEPSEADQLLDKLLEGLSPEEVLGRGGLLEDLKKRLIERALRAEMTHHLGYEKHAPTGRKTGDSRNGATRKSLLTDTGKVEIEVPRDRNGDFEPQIVPKHERRLGGFDQQVLALYARGMTTREIQQHLEEIYGTEVSPALISAVTDEVLDEVKEWQSRPLDAVYPVVYLDAIHLKMRSSGHVQNSAVYVAVGINREGNKELLGLWIGEAEGARFWAGVLTELQNRGVKDILIACVDGLTGFPEAIAGAFAKTQIQLCLVHMVRSSLRYVGWKERKAVAQDLRSIYTAATAEDGLRMLESFAAKWDDRFPKISQAWREKWIHLSSFFGYPPEIRRVIYTTNAVESINASLRKVTRKRGAFPNAESVRKVLYLAIRGVSKRWTKPIKNWHSALNHLTVVFEGRI
jgi:putative transposase